MAIRHGRGDAKGMDRQRLLSIGECMVEMAPADGGLFRSGFAGDTFNSAWYARELLPEGFHVDYASGLGNDPLSEALIGFMHDCGIGVSAVRIVPGARIGLYMIQLSETGERSFVYWRDTSAARQLAGDPALLRRAIERSGYIHFSGITLAILPPADRDLLLSELRRARAAGAVISFDPNIRPALWESRAAMLEACEAATRASTLLLPGLDEEREHFGTRDQKDVIERYRTLGAASLVLKKGSEGAVVWQKGILTTISPAFAPKIVDTTAAGDSFAGALLAHLMRGDALDRAARKAAIVAAEVIGHRGALVKLSMRLGAALN